MTPRRAELPPGPRQPSAWQTFAAWKRPTVLLERCRARYGRRFTLRLLGQPPFVILSDHEEIKQVFMAAPDVLHPGEGVRVLESIVGRHSVILLDEDAHMEQRKLMLPAFHGERMQQLSSLMTDLAERELARWPRDEAIELHPRLQRVTLEIILRVVFGLEQGAQLDALRETLTELLAFSQSPLSLLPFAQGPLSGHGPWKRFPQLHADVDRQLFALIEQRRAEAQRHTADDGRAGDGVRRGGDGRTSRGVRVSDDHNGDGGEDDRRADVLGMLLGAHHEDGSPMSSQELRDELVTALVAGHETTASQLAWAFERIAREPAVARRLSEELDEGSSDAYLTATIQEILRLRPVLAEAEPRVVKRPIEIGGITYPPGVALIASALLVHRDPDVYPRPYDFDPDRFLEQAGGRAPGTYTWIPFGGGRTRCLGASFALLEMKVVLGAVLGACEIFPAHRAAERTRRRSITLSPAGQARVILRDRSSATLSLDRSSATLHTSAETSAHDPDRLRVRVDQDVAAA
jgi:cytochrome P450